MTDASTAHGRRSATGNERIDALDGLRAVALLIVMAYHFGMGWLKGDSSASTSSTCCRAI